MEKNLIFNNFFISENCTKPSSSQYVEYTKNFRKKFLSEDFLGYNSIKK